MVNIDNTLNYLRESLANYSDQEMCNQIVRKIEMGKYTDENQFAKDLSEEEIAYLNSILENELDYARNAADDVRVKELTEMYEQLL
ncbi:sporulation protein [Virgibacillus kekensis]|uniref:Sporulation protein n=1 Tax=Virgibacillus kekensis TaxID=202261 RepID=A0ABV9DMJ6_9BACI